MVAPLVLHYDDDDGSSRPYEEVVEIEMAKAEADIIRLVRPVRSVHDGMGV